MSHEDHSHDWSWLLQLHVMADFKLKGGRILRKNGFGKYVGRLLLAPGQYDFGEQHAHVEADGALNGSALCGLYNSTKVLGSESSP